MHNFIDSLFILAFAFWWNSGSCFHQLSFSVELKQLFNTIVSKAGLNYAFEDQLHLMYLLLINYRLDLVANVANISRWWSESVAPFQIIKLQWFPCLI